MTNTVLFLKVLYNNSYSQNNEFRSGRPSKKCKKALYGGAENIHIYIYFLMLTLIPFQIEQHLQRAASLSVQEGYTVLNETKVKLDSVKCLLVKTSSSRVLHFTISHDRSAILAV